ncbi:MAG: hypothetical protein ABIP97_00695 [Chthoniobacterales bacterium]
MKKSLPAFMLAMLLCVPLQAQDTAKPLVSPKVVSTPGSAMMSMSSMSGETGRCTTKSFYLKFVNLFPWKQSDNAILKGLSLQSFIDPDKIEGFEVMPSSSAAWHAAGTYFQPLISLIIKNPAFSEEPIPAEYMKGKKAADCQVLVKMKNGKGYLFLLTDGSKTVLFNDSSGLLRLILKEPLIPRYEHR